VSVLSTVTTEELVLPVSPIRMFRTVERRGEGHFAVVGWTAHFSTALDALLAIREDVERTAGQYPVKVVIEWKGIPSGMLAPSTGTTL
jgi:hypothetical protein